MKTIVFTFVLLFASVLMVRAQIAQPGPDSFAANILIGQAYPSGNAYLKSFDNGNAIWPRTVLLTTLSSKAAQSSSTRVEATLAATTVPPDYIPAVEGLDHEHRACGTTQPRKKGARSQYQSEDFFDAVFDYCDPNDGVALYRLSALSNSVRVLAFTPDIFLTDIRTVSGRRPVTASEKQEIAKQKEELKRAGPCTTTPAFIDSAVQLMEARAADQTTVRISSYKTPGCSGHLATIYVLDVLRKKDLLRTFRISQSHGPL